MGGKYRTLVLSARVINNRLAVVRINVGSSTINIINTCAPTSDGFYNVLEYTLASL